MVDAVSVTLLAPLPGGIEGEVGRHQAWPAAFRSTLTAVADFDPEHTASEQDEVPSDMTGARR